MTPKYLDRSSRKKHVAAQYSSAQSADELRAPTRIHGRWDDSSGPVSGLCKTSWPVVPEEICSTPGCGPGVMAQALLKSRPHDFRISVLDQSRAMVEYCAASARSLGKVYPAVGQLEALPYADATFDVTLAMGVLEYANASTAVNEISRVTRPGGLAVTTMLNPLSPYRITEWIIYRPLLRALGAVEILPSCSRRAAAQDGHYRDPCGLRQVNSGD